MPEGALERYLIMTEIVSDERSNKNHSDTDRPWIMCTDLFFGLLVYLALRHFGMIVMMIG